MDRRTRPPIRRSSLATVVCALGVAAAVLVARRITNTSWPLAGAQIELKLAAGQPTLRVSSSERSAGNGCFRPSPDRIGVAASRRAARRPPAEPVLPFRLDYLVKIAPLHCLAGVTIGLEVIALSLISLGLVDAFAMLPLAAAAFGTSGAAEQKASRCEGRLLADARNWQHAAAVCAWRWLLSRVPLIARSRRLRGICERVGGGRPRGPSVSTPMQPRQKSSTTASGALHGL